MPLILFNCIFTQLTLKYFCDLRNNVDDFFYLFSHFHFEVLLFEYFGYSIKLIKKSVNAIL